MEIDTVNNTATVPLYRLVPPANAPYTDDLYLIEVFTSRGFYDTLAFVKGKRAAERIYEVIVSEKL